MKHNLTKIFLTIVLGIICLPQLSKAQGFDSTQIGKEYPYALPILGKKAYARGYKFQLPHGLMVNGFTTKQNIILENFQLVATTYKLVLLTNNMEKLILLQKHIFLVSVNILV